MWVVSSESTAGTLCALCMVSMATKALSMTREDVVVRVVVVVGCCSPEYAVIGEISHGQISSWRCQFRNQVKD